MKYNKLAAGLIRNRAFRSIQANPDLWKLWNEAKTNVDRGLLIAWEINNLATEAVLDSVAEDAAGEDI